MHKDASPKESEAPTARELSETLAHFQATGSLYQLPICGTLYTDGIRYLAQTAKAYWLLTDASVMGKSLMDKSYFVTVDFKRSTAAEREKIGCDATITYSDGNGNKLTQQHYQITDFPLDELRLYFVDNTLLLPSEY